MGVIVDLQPGDGILVSIIDDNDGKDGRELLVLEIAGVEGSKFSARLLNRSRVGQSYEYWDDRYVFTGEVTEDDPLDIVLTCYDGDGNKSKASPYSKHAIYLGAPIEQTMVTLMTADGGGREIVCRLGDNVLTTDGPRVVKAVYENVVVVENHNYVYLDRHLQKKLYADNWPDTRHQQTWNFGGAVAHILPITPEVADSLDTLKYSKEYAELQESYPELFEGMRGARSSWFQSYFPELADEPYPSELLNATAPHMLLALVDSGYFFHKNYLKFYTIGEMGRMWFGESGDRSDLMHNATRAVTDRLEALAHLLHKKTGEATPFEALLWEEVSYLKGTVEYLCTGVPGEKCEDYCESYCEYCAGGDPDYRGERVWR